MSTLVIADESPVAHRTHKCQECYRQIGVGEKYARQRGVFEGEPYVFKACAQCDRLIRDLWAMDFRGGDDWLMPNLSDFDEWSEVGALGLTWGRRHFLWSRQWSWHGRLMPYPEAAS